MAAVLLEQKTLTKQSLVSFHLENKKVKGDFDYGKYF